VKMATERNPKAFAPKIESTQHSRGCHCKKSRCVKKYCECFQNKIHCTSKCKCMDCDNGPKHGSGDATDQVVTSKKQSKIDKGGKKKQAAALSSSKSPLNKSSPSTVGPSITSKSKANGKYSGSAKKTSPVATAATDKVQQQLLFQTNGTAGTTFLTQPLPTPTPSPFDAHGKYSSERSLRSSSSALSHSKKNK